MSKFETLLPVIEYKVLKSENGYGYRITIKDHKGHLIREIEQLKVLSMFEFQAAEKAQLIIRRYQEVFLKEMIFQLKQNYKEKDVYKV